MNKKFVAAISTLVLFALSSVSHGFLTDVIYADFSGGTTTWLHQLRDKPLRISLMASTLLCLPSEPLILILALVAAG